MSNDSLSGTYGNRIAPDDNAFNALGDTDAGRMWNMKNLNPSWKGVCLGMPDKTSTNIVMYNYENSDIIQVEDATAGATDLFNIQITVYDHPIILADVIVNNVKTPKDFTYSSTMLNPEIPDQPWNDVNYPALESPSVAGSFWRNKVKITTANFLYKKAQLLEQIQLGRTTHCGCTGTMNANSQSDQGILHGGQITQVPVITSVIDTVNGKIIPQYTYGAEDFATMKSISQYPRSLKNASVRGGFYGIMRPDEDMTTFRNLTIPCSIFSEDMIGVANATTGFVPMPHQFCCITNGTLNFVPMNNNIIQVFLNGISASTTFDLTFRHGLESRPREGAMNSPFKMESPRLDQTAIIMNSSINATLSMDLWPADYNRFEWLGSMIKKLSPYLKAAGRGALAGMNGGLSGMVSGALTGVSDEISGYKRPRVEFTEEGGDYAI